MVLALPRAISNRKIGQGVGDWVQQQQQFICITIYIDGAAYKGSDSKKNK